MRWPWRRRGAIEPRPKVSRAMELQTAKEILAEIFHARPGEVEEMIQRRLEDRRGWILESLRMGVKYVSIFLGLVSKKKGLLVILYMYLLRYSRQ
jgi:transcriptional regulator CtsR